MAGIFMFGLTVDAQQIEWVRSRIYEVALSSAFAFTMITLAAIWRALHEPKERVLCLGLASLAYGLAVGARPSLLPGAVILLAPVWQVWREATETGLRSRIGSSFAAAVGPISLIGLGLMLYNFLRFGNPFEFGYRYELTGRDQTVVSQFSPHYFWFNIQYYILEPARWTGHFPFLRPVPPWPSSVGHLVPGLYYGGILFIGFPPAWLAFGAAVTRKAGPKDEFFGLRWFVLVLFLAFAACALTLFLFLYATNRYELDFLPALMLLAFIGLLDLESTTAVSPLLRSFGRLCWGLLLVYGAITNACASFDAYATANDVAGNVLYNRGLVDEAGERFQKALAFSPQDADAHGGLGNVLSRKGDFKGAIAQYQRAVEARPDFWEAYNNLGYCLLQAGRVDDAIIQYRKAIELRPQDATYHRGLGNAFLQKGMSDNAIVEFQKVLELEPDSADDAERLGDAFFREGKLSDAVVQYENVVRLKPDFAEAHNNLGYSLFATGDPDEAIAQYKKAIELRPNFAQAYNNLGNAYRGKRMAVQAIAAYQKAVALQSQFTPAQINLTWMLAVWPEPSIRNGTEAVAMAERANDFTGGRNSEVLRALAAAYAESGRFPDAITAANQASSLAATQSKTELVKEIRGDIKLYQNRSPCRSMAGP
jgi:tetratricopeptide (TPR) repeat protein